MCWRFDEKCWRGNCTCLRFDLFFQKFADLFADEEKFGLWRYKRLERETGDGETSWQYHGFGKTEYWPAEDYIEGMQDLLWKFIPHLVLLNFGNEMLERITDPKFPRLPVGHPLIGIDFSASPNFLRLGMNQLDYQESQKFGLISVVSFYVSKKNELKKLVLQELFADITHSTERISQGLDFALAELEDVMEKDGIEITGLYIYSDCSPADQKNKFFIHHLTELLSSKAPFNWIPFRYFQRPGYHNKFDFDSEGGLFKKFLFQASLNSVHSEHLNFTQLEDGGQVQLLRIAKFMNSKLSRWQHISDRATTTIRKSLVLPTLDYLNHQRAKVNDIKGISRNFAFAGVGYHKVWQRALMNLSDECLKVAFSGTPKASQDESFCGRWDNIDLEADAYPRLGTPNEAYRIRGAYERDGHLIKSARFTPIYSKLARKQVSFTIKTKFQITPLFAEESTVIDLTSKEDEIIGHDINITSNESLNEKNRKRKRKKGKRHTKKRKHNQN